MGQTVAGLANQDRVVPLTECLACGAGTLTTYADLGAQSLANDYHDGTQPLATFPLAIAVCDRCWHSQLTHSVDAELLYRNYLYVSGTTGTLMDSFRTFVRQAEADFPEVPQLRVLDIASNDGSLLRCFAERGHEVLGVDPAENLRDLSAANGVNTIVGFWDLDLAKSMDSRFDVIVAMNVLGHLPYPAEFLRACASVLAPGGRIYIQTSQSEMVERAEFDTIYHEHHSFFTARSFQALCRRVDLDIASVRKVPEHGRSYRWTLTASQAVPDSSVQDLLVYEESHGFYDTETYSSFGRRVQETASFLRQAVTDARSQGLRPVGYGAAAKGNTVLNLADVRLDFIVDDNSLKVGLLSPGHDSPIVASDALGTEDDLCLVILAWNFFDEIMARITAERRNPRDRFVRYFPDRRVEAG